MIKTLYKTFLHWSEKGSVYIISDPHFMDYDMNWRIDLISEVNKNAVSFFDEYLKASYITSYLIENLNKVCTRNDTLIILGDIGDEEKLTKLKVGYRVLITGNHDRGNTVYKSEYTLEPIDAEHRQGFFKKTYIKHLFDEVYDGPLFISKNIVLSHEPLPPGPYFNIHGHEHKDQSEEWLDALAGIKVSDYYLNACCEHNAFIPMNLNEIIKDKALGSFIDIHRVTIDKATENKLKKL